MALVANWKLEAGIESRHRSLETTTTFMAVPKINISKLIWLYDGWWLLTVFLPACPPPVPSLEGIWTPNIWMPCIEVDIGGWWIFYKYVVIQVIRLGGWDEGVDGLGVNKSLLSVIDIQFSSPTLGLQGFILTITVRLAFLSVIHTPTQRHR